MTWRDMSTAPKDGSLILILFVGCEEAEPIVARYRPKFDGDVFSWATHDDPYGSINQHCVKFWTPIPEYDTLVQIGKAT